MRDLDTLLGALTDRLLQAEARIEELERHETPGALAFGWMGAVGMLQMLPGLVGLWPGGGIRGSDRDGVADVSGNGLHLARTGGANIRYVAEEAALIPIMGFDGSTGYFSHADAAAFDITGGETILAVRQRGLTLGGWFRFDATTSQSIMAKFGAAGNRSYMLEVGTAHTFYISNDGSSLTRVDGGGNTTGEWRFIAGRYTPSSELKLWLHDDTFTETTSIPASIFNSSAEFRIGARSDNNNYFDGRAALCFLCAAAVPDVMIETFYQYSKGLFGL